MCIRQGNEICAGFTDIVRVSPIQDHIFRVRKSVRLAVCLVTTGHEDSLNQVPVDTARFQEIVCPTDVRLKGCEGASLGSSDDCLGSQMKDHFYFVLVDRAIQRRIVFQGATHNGCIVNVSTSDQLALRIPIADERDNICALCEKPLHKPGSYDPASPSDKDAVLLPVHTYFHIFHGGLPDDHSSSRRFFSLSVSMHDQNP